MKKNRTEIGNAILEKLQQGGEYTYNQLRVKGASVGLVSSIVYNQLRKKVNYRTEISGPEDWQQTTYISLKPA